MRDIIPIALTVAMLVVLAAARPLGQRFGRWLERREEERLQRDLAQADAFHERFFSDPEFALAYVRQRFPEEHELIAQLERHADRDYLTSGDAMRWTPPEAPK